MATFKERLNLILEINAKAFKKGASTAQVSINKIRKATDGLKSQLFSAKAAVVGFFGAFAGGGIINTITKFEKLEASLKTVTGSAENANKAFKFIQDFAATTPFQLEEVVASFIKLKALGLDPSEAALRSYGNTASAMGFSLNQMIEAVADAATGEFERLKEFGIKAKSQGDNVTFTFQGVATTVKKNAAEIEGYLRSIGDVQFAGAMEEQAKTLNVAVSNMKDNFAKLIKTIGDAGLTDVLIKIANAIGLIAERAREGKTIISNLFVPLIVSTDALRVAFTKTLNRLSIIFNNIKIKVLNLTLSISDAFNDMRISMAASLEKLPLVGERLSSGLDDNIAAAAKEGQAIKNKIDRLVASNASLEQSNVETQQAFEDMLDAIVEDRAARAEESAVAEEEGDTGGGSTQPTEKSIIERLKAGEITAEQAVAEDPTRLKEIILVDELKKIQQQKLKDEIAFQREMTRRRQAWEKGELEDKVKMMSKDFNEVADHLQNTNLLFKEKSEALKTIIKAARISQVIIESVTAAQALFTKYSETYPPPTGQILGGIAAAAAIAGGAGRVAQIRGAAQGGIVGGVDTGRDNQMMAVRSGEMIVPPQFVKPLMPSFRQAVLNSDDGGDGFNGSAGGTSEIIIGLTDEAAHFITAGQRSNDALGV
jgi:hypothetical protein